jgi:hypothetical protein
MDVSRTLLRIPGRIPGRSPGSPARHSDGVAISIAMEVDERAGESPQQSDDDDEDDDDDDSTPSYMLLYGPLPVFFNIARAIEEATEVTIPTKKVMKCCFTMRLC